MTLIRALCHTTWLSKALSRHFTNDRIIIQNLAHALSLHSGSWINAIKHGWGPLLDFKTCLQGWIVTCHNWNLNKRIIMRILLVEDDFKIASFIANGLEEAGFTVDHAADGKEGLAQWREEVYDAAIIDIMLPKLDGLTLIEEIRSLEIDTPVIILSAKQSVDDRIKGLQTGGDDYLTKPFSFAELLARVRALIRRSTGTTNPVRLTVGDLSVELLTREIVRAGQKIELRPREFSLLEYLMRNKETVLSKTMILKQIWGYDFDPQTDVVDVLVCRLRSKVDRDFDEKLIRTVRGVGYAIKA